MAAPQATSLRTNDLHIHAASSRCPMCDQTIPNEKLNDIAARIESRERELSATLTAQLNEKFARDVAAAEAKAKAELVRVSNDNAVVVEKLKQDLLEKESAARREGKEAAEAAMAETIAEAKRLTAAAEQSGAAVKAELETVRSESTAAIEKLKGEVLARESAAREEGRIAAESTLRGQLSEVTRLKLAAEAANSASKAELESFRETTTAAIERLKHDALSREAAARLDGKSAAEADMQAVLAMANEEKTTAQRELDNLRTTQQERLDEQRVALEKAGTDAVNAERARAFEEKLKLESQLQDITRKLQKKTAEELGEGAEVNLFDELKARFEGDKITRVEKGTAGADIIHDVLHNGKVCGRIVYDSKNRSAWRNEYVSKLRKDQVAAVADHAVLSTQVFPSGARQLHVQDGVVVTNPARVLVVVEILRRQILQTHSLRASNESKAEKTAALYEFITSELCNQLFEQIEVHSTDMLDLDVKEKKAHDATWKRRGELIRGVQKAHGDLCAQIEIVLGTARDNSNVDD